MLREALRTDTAWDEISPDTCALAWKVWWFCLSSIHEIQIPRLYGDLGEDVELHVFLETSEAAMGTVVYAVQRRGEETNGIDGDGKVCSGPTSH